MAKSIQDTRTSTLMAIKQALEIGTVEDAEFTEEEIETELRRRNVKRVMKDSQEVRDSIEIQDSDEL